MEKKRVVAALSALAQETRLDVFRRLVRAGSRGTAAGALAEALGIPSPTLSFHLKELRSAGLVRSTREGRSIRYAPDFAVIAELVAFLGESCCADESSPSNARSSATTSVRRGNGTARARKTKSRARKEDA
ncbi:MAG: helix-turn-helix transcriptional regulator [Spirochaetaceae bacterium]|nr:helix-turn-helix transcriptional regulator [Myxococcales bacterium]MCB9724857.1 helix-turn-helix transcriptional regulator [Spirochaetaceae bacterium]HPG28524.1 metalloregulator ArsR/SmtB family transcription factor [Myxococcota bacterium]